MTRSFQCRFTVAATLMLTGVVPGSAQADEPTDRPVAVQPDLTAQVHYERSRAEFLQGVAARDRDHHGMRAARLFSQAAESARLAEDGPLSGALQLAAQQAMQHLERTFAHGKSLDGVQFSPDKSHFLSWDRSGLVRLWEISTDKELASFQCGSGLTGVAFDPEAKHFLSWGSSDKLRLWDITKSEPIQEYAAKEPILGATFGNKGEQVFAWGRSYVHLWDVAQGEAMRTFDKSEDPIRDVAFSEDETRAFVQHFEQIVMWDVEQAKPIHWYKIKSDLHNQNGAARFLAANYANDFKGVHAGLWKVKHDEQKATRSYLQRTSTRGAVLSQDRSRIISWDESNVSVLYENGNRVAARLRLDHPVEEVAVRDDRRRIATRTSDRKVRVWDVEKERVIFTFAHFDDVHFMTFSHDGSGIFTWSRDGNARLWSLLPQKPVHRFANSVSVPWRWRFSEDMQHRIRLEDDTIEVWNFSQDEPISTFKSDVDVFSAVMNEQATYVMTWGWNKRNDRASSYQLWDVQRNRLVRKIHGLSAPVAINHDGTRCVTTVLSGSASPFVTEVILWDISEEKAKQIHSQLLDGNNPVEIENIVFEGGDGRFVGSHSYLRANIVDVRTMAGKQIWSQGGPDGKQGKHLWINRKVTKSLSWKKPAKGESRDSAVLLWEFAKAEPLKSFPHEEEPEGAVFAEDESRFLTWTREGIVRFWDVDESKPLRTFHCGAATAGAALNSDATRFLVWSNSGYLDSSPRSVQVWDITEGRRMGEFRHNAPVRGAMFHPNNDFLLSWGDECTVRVWNIFAPEPLLTFDHDPFQIVGGSRRVVSRCVLDQTGNRIITRDQERIVRVWDLPLIIEPK